MRLVMGLPVVVCCSMLAIAGDDTQPPKSPAQQRYESVMAQMLTDRDFHKALGGFGDVLKLDPLHVNARQQLIRILESERNWSEAIIESQKLIEITSDHKTVSAEMLAKLRTLLKYASPAADMCNETTPSVLSKEDPKMTFEARRKRINGIVRVYFEVDTTGRPTNIHVIEGLGHGLDERSTEKLADWRFRPGVREAKPTTCASWVTFKFNADR
jgi:TonB family protein